MGYNKSIIARWGIVISVCCLPMVGGTAPLQAHSSADQKKIKKHFIEKGWQVQSVDRCETKGGSLIVSYFDPQFHRGGAAVLQTRHGKSRLFPLGSYGSIAGPEMGWCEDLDRDGTIEVILAVPGTGSNAAWNNEAWEWDGEKYIKDVRLTAQIAAVGSGQDDWEPAEIQAKIRAAITPY